MDQKALGECSTPRGKKITPSLVRSLFLTLSLLTHNNLLNLDGFRSQFQLGSEPVLQGRVLLNVFVKRHPHNP